MLELQGTRIVLRLSLCWDFFHFSAPGIISVILRSYSVYLWYTGYSLDFLYSNSGCNVVTFTVHITLCIYVVCYASLPSTVCLALFALSHVVCVNVRMCVVYMSLHQYYKDRFQYIYLLNEVTDGHRVGLSSTKVN